MTKKELLLNDGYWTALIECELYYKNYKGKNRREKLIKSILRFKNELIEHLNTKNGFYSSDFLNPDFVKIIEDIEKKLK